MPTIEQRKSVKIGQAIGDVWHGRSQYGKFWILELPEIAGALGTHVRPDGNTQDAAWWFDTREEVDAAIKLYDEKHRTTDWHEKLVDLVADCIFAQRNGVDLFAAPLWGRVVEHWGNAEISD